MIQETVTSKDAMKMGGWFECLFFLGDSLICQVKLWKGWINKGCAGQQLTNSSIRLSVWIGTAIFLSEHLYLHMVDY